MQYDRALNTGCLGQRRISRYMFATQVAFYNTPRHANAVQGDFGNATGAADQAANNSTHTTTRDSARNSAALKSRCRRKWRFLFLHNLEFLSDLGGVSRRAAF